jgi:hypothetical protein
MPSALALLGRPGERDRLGLAERVGPVRQLAVLLVDGLGHRLLPAAARHAPLLAECLAGRAGRIDELTSAVPSTTPTSLVTLTTGTLPGAHGVLGFTILIPGTDRVLTHIQWRDEPVPHDWQPQPTCFQHAAAAGIASAAVLPPAFAGSGLTEAAYAGARFVGASGRDELGTAMLAELRAGTPLVYGYHATLDTMAHLHGIGSPQWAGAAARFDELLQRLVDGLPAGTALLVTADHGGLDIPAAGRLDLDADPRLAAGVRAVAGEPRWRYLHTEADATADVLATWRAVLGERAQVLTRDEAIDTGWFGPVTDAHRPRIGDVVVACLGDTVILAGAHEPPEVARLVAFHGSITPAETAIPLISVVGS